MSMYARRQQAVATSVPRRVTAAAYAQRTLAARENEYHVRDIHEYHNRDSLAKAFELSEARVKALRRQRRFQRQNDEIRLGAMIEADQNSHHEARILAEQDNNLAKALFAEKQKEQSRELNARRICDENDELAQLRQKLAAAQLNKTRAIQLEERSLRREQEKNVERQLDAMMVEQRFMQPDTTEEEEARIQASKDKAREDLDNQIREQQRLKQLSYQRYLEEKEEVDAVVRKMEEADLAKQREAARKQEQLRIDTARFIEERRRHKIQEKQDFEDEMRKIEEHQRQQEIRHEHNMALKKEQNEKRNRLKGRATAEIERKRQEEENVRNMLEELYQEQAEQKAIETEQALEAKRERMKQEMLAANNYQKEMKIRRQQEEVANEALFREKMMAKFAEDDRIARMTKQRQREEKRKYLEEVENMLEDRRRQYAAAIEDEHRMRQKEAEEEAYKKQVVEEERQRLLRQYAVELKGHLPQGVIKTEADYELVYGVPMNKNNNRGSSASGGYNQRQNKSNNGRETRIY